MTGTAPIRWDLDNTADWLWQLINRTAGDLPVFATEEWAESDELTRVASLARWALVQLDELSPEVIAARLAAEISAGRIAHLAAMKQASVAISRAHDWRAQAAQPTRAEILRRRAGRQSA